MEIEGLKQQLAALRLENAGLRTALDESKGLKSIFQMYIATD